MDKIIEHYFDAWNNYDADALIATFAPGGTYEDPNTGGPLSGEAIGASAGAAIRDLSEFELRYDGRPCGERRAGGDAIDHARHQHRATARRDAADRQGDRSGGHRFYYLL